MTKVLIWSNEHRGWWRPEQCGYTNYKELAGEYELEEAIKICRNASQHIDFGKHYPNEDTPIPNETMYPVDQ